MYERKRFMALLLAGALTVTMGCGETGKAGDAPAGQSSAGTESVETVAAEEITATSAAEAETVKTETEEETVMEETTPILKDCVEAKMGCRFGCAITGDEPWDMGVWNIVTTHFNCVTFGNELKPDSLFGYSVSTCPGTEEAELNGETITVPVMDFSRPEKLLNKIAKWNETHPDQALKVRGHVLLWHAQTPEWFFHEDYDKTKPYVSKEEMDKRLEWYIRSVLTHFVGEESPYKDLFYGWDVVNEAISDAMGSYRTDQEKPEEPLSEDRHGSNSSWWHVYQSEEFIINAFKYANKYAPETLELYYNDYNECQATKRAGIIKLLEAVKAQEGAPGEGTRITAMGMQGHYGIAGPSYNEVQTSAEAYGEVVGQVQITELDMRASESYDGTAETRDEEYEKQRKQYNLYYFGLQAAQASGKVKITGITFWGTVDKYSWLQSRSNVGGGNTTNQGQCPLLFDNAYKPKPCFYVFAE